MEGEAGVLCLDISSVSLFESLCERKGLGGGEFTCTKIKILTSCKCLNSGMVLTWKIICIQHILKIEIQKLT